MNLTSLYNQVEYTFLAVPSLPAKSPKLGSVESWPDNQDMPIYRRLNQKTRRGPHTPSGRLRR